MKSEAVRAEPPRLNCPNVLVVDDDPNGLLVLTRILNRAGCAVAAAIGADDALRKLDRHPYDVVVVELAMKQVSGIRLIEMMKASPFGNGLRIVAVTAPIRPSLADALGCDGMVFRPVDSAALVAAVTIPDGPASGGESRLQDGTPT